MIYCGKLANKSIITTITNKNPCSVHGRGIFASYAIQLIVSDLTPSTSSVADFTLNLSGLGHSM